VDVKKDPDLPALWEQLLPKAFALVDEIAKHGGIADPFFTFGGGTVLMLRYEHRFSKDIDIFVPDPQSLGFINPRLSDVAEGICAGQYTEAANFVKLILEQGEIDFVASPNLLPDELAFEYWTLCGRRVRVETAAEIIAKKMYHRGAQPTARDLFDLSMVIERAPKALIAAEPFLLRHLDAFTANLAKAGTVFTSQFDAIECSTYTPTLSHAAHVAKRYLDNVKRRHRD